MANLVSTLDIRLIDDVSPNAAKIEASLKKMEAEAKEVDAALGKSGTGDKFQANLRKIGAQVPHIEAVAKAWKGYAAAEGIAAERGDWTAKQAAQVKNWESVNIAGIRAVMGAERAHEAARLAQIEKADAASKRAVEAQYRREEHLAHQQQHMAEHHGVVNYALTSAAMAVSAHEIGHVAAEAWAQGSELQHERMQLKNAGRTPEEMQHIEAAARGVMANVPTSGMVENLKVIAETTSAFGSVEHAIGNLSFMMKAMSVLKSAGGDKIQGDAGTVGRYFAKTFEERMTKPEEFQNEARQMIPAMVASGGVFNPQELYAFSQQAKSSLPNYNMRFLSKIVPSLVTAMGGDRAGTAANAFNSIIMGKVNDKKQAEAWEKFGLLDDKKVIKKAGNVVSWSAGAVKDTNLALQDPLEWAEKVALPAMRAKGVNVDDRLELAKELGTMFRNQNGNMFANEMMQEASRSRLHKDEGIYSKAGDLEKIYENDLGEFTVAAGAVEESLKSLSAAATAPLMHPVAEALSSLSEGVNSVAKYGFEHPTIAATAGIGAVVTALGSAGWLGMKLMNGFGLKGSAIALDGAAASLEAAAGRLAVGGGGSVLNKAGTAGEGAAVTNAGRAALAIPGAVEIGSAVVAGGIAVATIGLVKASAETEEPGKGGQWSAPTYGSLGLDRERLAAQQAEKAEVDAHIATIQAKSKLGPGMESPELFPLRDRSASLASSIATLAKQLTTLDRLPREDDRETRARSFVRPRSVAPMPPVRPGEYTDPESPDQAQLPDREAERGRAYEGLRRPEEFGPPMPPPAAREPFGPPQPPPAVAPTVDLTPAEQGLMQLMSLSTEAGTHMETALNVTASPTVNMAALDAFIAKVNEARAALASLGSVGAGPNASISPRRSFTPAPAGPRYSA